MDATDTTPLLSIQSLCKEYGPTRALRKCTLEIRAREVHAIAGENGAGKSTLIRLLSGAERPDAGKMLLEGRSYAPRGPDDALRKGFSVIHQELTVIPQLTVEENLFLGRESFFLNRRRLREYAGAILERLGHPEIDPAGRVCELSMAAMQIVEIGRALAHECHLILFDEPTARLSRKDAEQFFSVIRGLREMGCGIVYVTHVLEEIEALADRVTVLRDGRITARIEREDVSRNRLIEAMLGSGIPAHFRRRKRKPGATVLEVQNLRGPQLVKHASFSLRRGEIKGIYGVIGSGRTELLRCIFGLDHLQGGEIRVEGMNGPMEPDKAWNGGMGFLSEDRKGEGLATQLSVVDNLTLPRLERGGGPALIRPWLLNASAGLWMEKLRIRAISPEQPLWQLSGGSQQKVAFARLVDHDADMLLLDEPTRGIDLRTKALIYRWLDGLAAGSFGKSKAILLASNHLPEILGICDEVAVMHQGRLSPFKPVESASEAELYACAVAEEPAHLPEI